jgi:hypothetical protein
MKFKVKRDLVMSLNNLDNNEWGLKFKILGGILVMHSCCCICFIVRCGFGFYLIWTQNLFLNGFGNKFN